MIGQLQIAEDDLLQHRSEGPDHRHEADADDAAGVVLPLKWSSGALRHGRTRWKSLGNSASGNHVLAMYLYVCMYACMYVCLYVCLYVCMSVCMYVCLSVCILYVCMYVLSVCMYACMHVCMWKYNCYTMATFFNNYTMAIFFWKSNVKN